MKTAMTVLALVIALAFAHDAVARSSSSDSRPRGHHSSSSDSRPRMGHHSGKNGPSEAGWGGGGGYHN